MVEIRLKYCGNKVLLLLDTDGYWGKGKYFSNKTIQPRRGEII